MIKFVRYLPSHIFSTLVNHSGGFKQQTLRTSAAQSKLDKKILEGDHLSFYAPVRSRNLISSEKK